MTSLSQEGLGGVTGEDAGSEDSPAGTEENTFFKDRGAMGGNRFKLFSY